MPQLCLGARAVGEDVPGAGDAPHVAPGATPALRDPTDSADLYTPDQPARGPNDTLVATRGLEDHMLTTEEPMSQPIDELLQTHAALWFLLLAKDAAVRAGLAQAREDSR